MDKPMTGNAELSLKAHRLAMTMWHENRGRVTYNEAFEHARKYVVRTPDQATEMLARLPLSPISSPLAPTLSSYARNLMANDPELSYADAQITACKMLRDAT